MYECMGVRLREKERFLNTMAPVNCDPLLRLSCFNDYSMADIEWIGSLTHSLFLSLSLSLSLSLTLSRLAKIILLSTTQNGRNFLNTLMSFNFLLILVLLFCCT